MIRGKLNGEKNQNLLEEFFPDHPKKGMDQKMAISPRQRTSSSSDCYQRMNIGYARPCPTEPSFKCSWVHMGLHEKWNWEWENLK